MKNIRLLFLFFPLLFGACASVKYEQGFNPKWDPANYETFGLLPIPHPEYDKQAYRILGQEDFSQVVVRAVLESKGYRFAEDDAADFYVGIRAAAGIPELQQVAFEVAKEDFAFSFERISGSLGDPFPGYETPASDKYDHAPRAGDWSKGDASGFFVIVEVFDGKSRELVWSGWARAHTELAYRNDEKRAEVIANLVRTFVD